MRLFFSLKNIVLMKFSSLDEIRTIEKKTHFLIVPSTFCFSSPIEMILFEDKKKTHSNLIVVLTVKIVAQKDVVRSFAWGGGTSTHFWPLSSLYLSEENILEFRVYDNLCSTHRDLSTLRAVLEKPRKGGSP